MKTPLSAIKSHLLHWAAAWPYALFLDTCSSSADRYGAYECLVGVAQSPDCEIITWEQLQQCSNEWTMGLLPYDLKHCFEPSLGPEAATGIPFPEVAWFVPEVVAAIRRDSGAVEWLKGHGSATHLAALLTMTSEAPSVILRHAARATQDDKKRTVILRHAARATQDDKKRTVILRHAHASTLLSNRATQDDKGDSLTSNFTRDQYLTAVEALRNHIREGDCYEINLAQAFSSAGITIDPVAVFQSLTAISPVPFAAFFRWKEQYVLCASPERFLQKQGDRLVSQPIKGTAKRGQTQEEDATQIAQLRTSQKEQAENVMIVDLTRNDLHRSCTTGSVEVPYLFEIQTFPTVHQMVSTVTGQVQPGLAWQQVVTNTFPPGSMTGAPKVKAMELIRRYEGLTRGAYAGSLGYCTPDGDFDLNVVIRSLVWDSASGQLSYHVGGAITYDSDPEAEYEETLLKALAIIKALNINLF